MITRISCLVNSFFEFFEKIFFRCLFAVRSLCAVSEFFFAYIVFNLNIIVQKRCDNVIK
nr:MAG TPA: hypothetical protein [Caudoviricetes sp.]